MEIQTATGAIQTPNSAIKAFAIAKMEAEASRVATNLPFTSDLDFTTKLDGFSLESVVEHKISRFLDQVGGMYPEDLHSLILGKVEKPLLTQILRRTGGNQVHASRILGINRNTLRKKMKIHGVKA